ncbi:MAG: EAL domain-containing protein [Cyanobacteria bacterium P01_A01_bin.83]
MNITSYKSKLKQFRLRQVPTWFKSYSYSLLLLTIVVTAIVLGIRRLGTLQALELLTYDWMVNLHNQDEIDPRLLIVEITDQDIEKHNSYPLKDETFAKLLRNIQKFQPKVIGFDIYREVAYPPGTDALRKELQQDNVIVIEFLGDDEHKVAAPPGVAPEQIGFNDVVVDVGDNVLRRNLMYAISKSDEDELPTIHYSFSLRTSLKYLADKNLKFQVKDDYLQIGSVKFRDLKSNSGGYQLKNSETAGKQILINYRSPNVARRVSLSEVLAGEVSANAIKDKIVLIGNTSPSIKDVIPTPYYLGDQSFMPGVVAHAQMVSQIISVVENESGLFWFWSEWLEGFWVWGWALLAMVIAWKLRHPLSMVVLGIVSVSALGLIYSVAFALGGWIPFIPPLASFAITIGCVLGYKALYNLFYDDLTQLPNRSLFAKQLKKLKQRNQGKSSGFIAILCLDLHRFKLINNGLGSQAGDRILVITAQRLQQNLDSQAILARVGADEFAIALKITTNLDEAIKLANQIEHALSVPYQLSQQDVFTSASIGIVVDNSDDDFQPEELMQASHTAMYKAKASGKICHEVFATNMQEQALKRLQLEADLNQAIKEQEFELYYQPIICLKTGTVKGFEALVRWHSPTRGFVSPGAFIPIAEETGLIVPMGEWILTTACAQMQEWCQQFPQAESVVMSVNLSSRQFAQSNLIAQIKETLSATGLNAANLKLEITESMVMDNVENTITLLNQLQELKIKISMDDFGTGFSSFSYLHRFPINTLKVDRSFVSNMSQGQKNKEIVNTIIILAHRLGMDVIAEGIETESELAILKDFNCEYAQGYFFAKPMAKNDATELLQRNKLY